MANEKPTRFSAISELLLINNQCETLLVLTHARAFEMDIKMYLTRARIMYTAALDQSLYYRVVFACLTTFLFLIHTPQYIAFNISSDRQSNSD